MIKRLLLLAILPILSLLPISAQYVAPVSGKAYRIMTPGKGYNCMAAEYKENLIYTRAKQQNQPSQMWILEDAGEGAVYIQNGYTGLYVQHSTQLSGYFRMDSEPKKLFIKSNPSLSSYYNITTSNGESRGMHSDPFNKVVLWYASTGAASASEWVFEEAEMSISQLRVEQDKFREIQDQVDNLEDYNLQLQAFFTDLSCTELRGDFQRMNDATLMTVMSDMPEVVCTMALKIKNNKWKRREKEFRVQSYKPYANSEEWASRMIVNQTSNINNPTGIYANCNDLLYVFVANEIPEGAYLALEEIESTNTAGVIDTLKQGMNIVPVSFDLSTIFVRYVVDTHSNDKKISDYPDIKIHIEQGIVNGYFNKNLHTDADWVDITQNLATHPIIQVKGDRVIYHMEKKWITADNCCKNKITDAIGWWDDMAKWDHNLMGWDKGLYPEKFNNLHCAITLDDDHTYQAATAYRTQYGVKYIHKLLPYNTVQSNADNAWGPGHELGHSYQGSIRLITTTELSCNLFANLTLYNLGKYMSRGDSVGTLCNDFAEKKPWISMIGESKMRMFWQLYLYFHLAGHDTDFYPKLFALMRENPLGKGNPIDGTKDILLFAEMCARAAETDLSEFFTVWGFFVPVNSLTDMENGNESMTVTQTMIDVTLAKIKSYSKKASAIEFIEDRIESIARLDGESGNRLTNDLAIGTAGDVGQYTYYNVSGSPRATGYKYTKVGKSIVVEGGVGAVGFKVYDSNGQLQAISNKYKFAIPESLASDESIRITVAQGDGVEIDIESKTKSDENGQKESLVCALKIANSYKAHTETTGKRVGYYRTSKLEVLNALITNAEAALQNNDQSQNSYGAWTELIDAEIGSVYSNPTSKVQINELNYYTITNKTYNLFSLDAQSSGLVVSKGNTSQAQRQWMFIPVSQGLYYLKSKSGLYISSIAKDSQATLSSSQSAAIKFRVVESGKGEFYLQRENIYGGCLNAKPDYSVIGKESKDQNSWWRIICIEDNQSTYETARLDSLLTLSRAIIEEVLNADELDKGNLVLNDNVLVKDQTLLSTMELLLEEFESASIVRQSDAIEDYDLASESLALVITKVSSSYGVIPSLPSDIGAGVVWYYIQNVSDNRYCKIERNSSRYLNNLMLTADTPNANNPDMLWCFVPTGNGENQYHIFNGGSGAAVYFDDYFKCTGGSSADSYVLEVDTAQLGFNISKGNEYWYSISTYPKLNTRKGAWRLIEADKTASAILCKSDGQAYIRMLYGVDENISSDLFIASPSTVGYVDLKEVESSHSVVEMCRSKGTNPNAIYATSEINPTASQWGVNVLNSIGVCSEFSLLQGSLFYTPVAFTAISATYFDANAAKSEIRPLMIPFAPNQNLITALPSVFESGTPSLLKLDDADFSANTPMFVRSNLEPVHATATNVSISASSTEDITNGYLTGSYVGCKAKSGSYVGTTVQYSRLSSDLSISPMDIYIKALPGSITGVSSFQLLYDGTLSIEESIEEPQNEASEIYDLTGRRIAEIRKPGIYIVNGKKRLVEK